MNVTISVCGRFHAFDLASELAKQNHLKILITSYPAFKASEWGVSKDKIKALSMYEVATRAWNAFPKSAAAGKDLLPRIYELFDKQVSSTIPVDTDIFVGWSSMCFRSLKKAAGLGASTIVERGSTHISFQKNILERERELTGAKVAGVQPRSEENELREYETADFISVPSSFAKKTFEDAGVNGAKVIQIPYGVNLSQFSLLPKRDSTFRVIHCGAISIRKGVHHLLKAFTELNLVDSELWLIGSVTDEMKPFLSRYAAPNIHVKGPFPQNTLREYYSQGSVFCIASLEEGLAMVIPQAMACGLPVICTENSGGGDIVRDQIDGFVIPASNAESLKSAIQRFHDDPELCRGMGDSAHNRVQDGFTWKDYGNKMIHAYSNMKAKRATNAY